MSKQKNYLIGGAAAADEYINLEELIPEIKDDTNIEEDHTREIKDRLERMLKCSIMDLIFTLPPSQKEQRWEYMKWEAMDDDEKEEYKMIKLY